jgi:D-arabinose 1-dehydrogenase-like Zn-dependent alcohol dehydrogenase
VNDNSVNLKAFAPATFDPAVRHCPDTTLCGTDVHIQRDEYPVVKGLTVGHEPVGIIERLGSRG